MGGGKLLIVGLGWPFVVAAIAVLIPYFTDKMLSDRQAYSLFALSLCACPAVAGGLFARLLIDWRRRVFFFFFLARLSSSPNRSFVGLGVSGWGLSLVVRFTNTCGVPSRG